MWFTQSPALLQPPHLGLSGNSRPQQTKRLYYCHSADCKDFSSCVRNCSLKPDTVGPWTTQVWTAQEDVYTILLVGWLAGWFPTNTVHPPHPRVSQPGIRQPQEDRRIYFLIPNRRFPAPDAQLQIEISIFALATADSLLWIPSSVESFAAKSWLSLSLGGVKSYLWIFSYCGVVSRSLCCSRGIIKDAPSTPITRGSARVLGVLCQEPEAETKHVFLIISVMIF